MVGPRRAFGHKHVGIFIIITDLVKSVGAQFTWLKPGSVENVVVIVFIRISKAMIQPNE